jgi:hypothetical protein
MLVAQAATEPLVLLTNDEILARNPRPGASGPDQDSLSASSRA